MSPADDAVAILGGGAGARAAAAELALAGWDVRLWDLPDFLEEVADLLGDHHLEVDGQIEGRADLRLVTGDIQEACAGASLVLIVSQAAGHRPIAEELAQVLTYDQTVVVMPGSTGGALEVASVIDAERGLAPVVAETATLPFAARGYGQRGVTIRHYVKLVKLAALPPAEAPRIVRRLRPIFPGLQAAENVLETSLSNGNPVIHPAVTLLNAAWIERVEGGWEFYHEGVTPAVARLIEAADEERLALGEAMGLELIPEPEMSVHQGYSRVADYLIAYRDGPGFQDLGGPESLEHRYITEDVAYAMMTWLELAEVFGVPMPVMQSMVQISSVLLGCDYRTEAARGLAELGLEGMSADEILARCCGG
ncbi:MAG: NAD/NADP octopine/nopaline dehydrogenase family protein [Armatimonadota bacterium]|nr:NAD/NADP octopine/nopaline dehydrogenase family protein [Armatimonadota bacterium]